MRAAGLVLGMLGGCATAEPPPAPADSDAPAVTASAERVLLVSALSIPEADATGHLDGFDLDGAATAAGDPTGCGVPDDLDERGRLGIDAALNHLYASPALQATEAVAVGDVLQTAIDEGNLLLAVRLSGLDDPRDDDAVHVEIVRAKGLPRLAAAGGIVADQTFELDATVPSVDLGDVRLVDGTLVAHGFDLTLPVDILGTPIVVDLREAALRVTLADDGTFHGAIGGALVAADLLSLVEDTPNINDVVGQALEAVLGFWLDLDGDGDGTCERISFVLDASGVPAFLFDGAALDTGAADTEP
jgi:hypothetical protein